MIELSATRIPSPLEIMHDYGRVKNISGSFQKLFENEPTIWGRAPGRVDLMGSHTDYNEGYVLTEAIDRDTWIAARPRDDGLVRIGSLNLNGIGEFELENLTFDRQVPWTNYVRGVAAVMQEQGYSLRGFDGLVHSTIPFGSGLSSSAALEVAAAVLFDALSGLNIDRVELARMCQRAENEFVGMNCGILDQYTSTMGVEGGVLLLDCRHITSQTKPLSEGWQVVICDTRAKRELTGSEYPERRAQCEQGARILANFYPQIKTLRDASLEQLDAHLDDIPEVIARRCRFIIQENQRVLDLADALASADLERVGTLMCESYNGARDLYEISSFEMGKMMDAMLSGPGVIGARQAGAGFGGCMVAVVRQEEVGAFSRHVVLHYQTSTGIDPKVYPVEAAAGAGVMEI